MSSQTAIANMALRRFGQSRITSINSGTPAALAILDVWEAARKAALRAHHWNFATKQAVLTASAVTPPFKWAFAYPAPVDYLRLISFNGVPSGTSVTYYDVASGADYGSDRGVILSNDSTAEMEYVADVPEYETWDEQFTEAFSYKLAEMVAPALMADGGQSSVVMAQKNFLAVLQAMSSDAIESKPRVVNALSGSQYLASRSLAADDWWPREPGEWGLPLEYGVTFNPHNVS